MRKFTIANVDDWSASDVEKLRLLLKERRGYSRAERSIVDTKIFGMLLERIPPEKHWRLWQSRPAPKLMRRG